MGMVLASRPPPALARAARQDAQGKVDYLAFVQQLAAIHSVGVLHSHRGHTPPWNRGGSLPPASQRGAALPAHLLPSAREGGRHGSMVPPTADGGGGRGAHVETWRAAPMTAESLAHTLGQLDLAFGKEDALR